ncbi:uncharacterized protein APUU_60298A [Aspergillus puulaauensis]|uniref:Uncharacterized protein n=1 Tax=Aspergillus puulaauensis TaxID=1220207 RepID=A0A7R8AS21_9EURO|nr:uncharacterized protein APUU_60298A [Aspergillus puulaauensis]BCS27250.1 hypothetical protein APUU_60298A [Aspergillus puulaauensis]
MFTSKVGDQPMEPPERNASFALSCLLIGFAFGFPLAVETRSELGRKTAESGSDSGANNALDELVGVFNLIRKMISYSTPAMDGVHMSELGGLLFVGQGLGHELGPEQQGQTQAEAQTQAQPSHHAINNLNTLLNKLYPPHHKTHQIISSTLSYLSKLLTGLDANAELVSLSFMWVCDVPAEFIDLVQVYDPLALVVLAHYCVVLHRLRERWWIATWGERVLDDIKGILGVAWSGEVEWAVGMVNQG